MSGLSRTSWVLLDLNVTSFCFWHYEYTLDCHYKPVVLIEKFFSAKVISLIAGIALIAYGVIILLQ